MSRFRVNVIGALAVDVKARSAGPLVLKADVPGRVQVMLGGVARNMSKNLARLGIDVACFGAIGDDSFGAMLRTDLASDGIAIDRMLVCEQPTAAWVGILNAQGDLEMGVFGGAILEAITRQRVADWADRLVQADMLCVDATLPRAAVDAIVTLGRSHGIPIYLNPASVARAATVADGIGAVTLLTANALETQVLTGLGIDDVASAGRAARALIERGVSRAIVTLGAGGLVYADAGLVRCAPAHSAEVVDTTGAGDALAAMFVCCHLLGLELDDTLDCVLQAAAATVASSESASEQISHLAGSGMLRTHALGPSNNDGEV